MANREHLARLKNALKKQNIRIWNNWRERCAEVIPDLEGAALAYSFLRHANLCFTFRPPSASLFNRRLQIRQTKKRRSQCGMLTARGPTFWRSGFPSARSGGSHCFANRLCTQFCLNPARAPNGQAPMLSRTIPALSVGSRPRSSQHPTTGPPDGQQCES